MDPAVTASLITAGAGLLGGSIGGGYSAGANKLNRKTMARQFKYNRAMRSTAVQDRMADLKAAGINPILAGRYDADTPASTALQSHNPAVGAAAMTSAMGNVASSAFNAMKTVKDTEMVDTLLSSAQVTQDVADYLQGITGNIDTIADTIENGIGRFVKFNYDMSPPRS